MREKNIDPTQEFMEDLRSNTRQRERIFHRRSPG